MHNSPPLTHLSDDDNQRILNNTDDDINASIPKTDIIRDNNNFASPNGQTVNKVYLYYIQKR
jgi:hypothetical protein